MRKCERLHEIFNSMQSLRYTDIDNIQFENGIYIFFEEGETYSIDGRSYDRIVRVGTDTGENQLKSRLRQHFENENKDRSIFRKNIGRAILNKNNDPFLEYWNRDLTKRIEREKYFDKEKELKRLEIEKAVTTHLKENMTFVVFKLDDKEERLRYEKGIISALYHDNFFKASDNWLGNYVPRTRGTRVAECGMWLTQGLKAEQISDKEILNIEDIVRRIKNE